MKPPRKIPIILGLSIILLGLVAASFLVKFSVNLFPQAQSTFLPESVRITNLGPDRFTISWQTSTVATGLVKYGSSPASLNLLALDDRDQTSQKIGSYFLHHVTVSSLEIQKDYYFKINSAGRDFLQEGRPYQIKTVQLLDSTTVDQPAYGQILKKSGQPARNVLVYLEIPNAQPLSCLTDSSGHWLISKNQILANAATETISVAAGPDGQATAILPQNFDQPAPEITLGQDYDFQKEKEPLLESSQTELLSSSKYVLPAYSASPSGQLTTTPTPTLRLTLTPTPKPTVTPTLMPTVKPTVTPAPQLQPGSGWLSVLTIGFGFLMMSAGFVFLKI